MAQKIGVTLPLGRAKVNGNKPLRDQLHRTMESADAPKVLQRWLKPYT